MEQFRKVLPMTARLFDVVPALYRQSDPQRSQAIKNFLALLAAGTLPRLITGGARVAMDHPRFNKSPDSSREEKMKSTIERTFMEVIGTVGYVLAIPVAQDGIAWALQKGQIQLGEFKLGGISPKQLMHDFILHPLEGKDISVSEFNHIEKMLNESLAMQGNVIDQTLYDNVHSGLYRLRDNIKEKISPQAFELVEPQLKKMYHRLRGYGTLCLLGGLLSGAVFGGIIMQKLNDGPIGHVFVPKAMAWLGLDSQKLNAQAHNQPQKTPMVYTPATLPLPSPGMSKNAFATNLSSKSSTINFVEPFWAEPPPALSFAQQPSPVSELAQAAIKPMRNPLPGPLATPMIPRFQGGALW